MDSYFLIIGEEGHCTKDLGARHAKDFTQAKELLKKGHTVAVVSFCLDKENEESALEFNSYIKENHPEIYKVLLVKEENHSCILDIVNSGKVCAVLESSEQKDLSKFFLNGLNWYKKSQQNEQLLEILEKTKNSNEKKIKEIKEELKKNAHKETLQNKKIETLERVSKILDKIIFKSFKSKSLVEVSERIMEPLKKIMNLTHVDIHIQEGESQETGQKNHISFPLFQNDHKQFGHIVFKKDTPFLKNEKSLLEKVSENISPVVYRVDKLKEIEKNKSHWSSTFNAIETPLCLTNEKFEIIQFNSFFKKTISSLGDLEGQNVFKTFFKKKVKDPSIEKNEFTFKNFKRVKNEKRTFVVYGQKIRLENENHHYLIVFRDVTESEKVERMLVESSKSAELGTVASSLAHELNQPLSSILSYLHFLEKELRKSPDKNEEHIKNLHLLENQAQECKKIIGTLLKIARPLYVEKNEKVYFEDEVSECINQYKNKRKNSVLIEWENKLPEKNSFFLGNKEGFIKVMEELLKNSEEAIKERIPKGYASLGEIKIKLQLLNNTYVLSFQDNGCGMNTDTLHQSLNPLFTTKNKNLHSGLGLSYSFKIISEWGGKFEIQSWINEGTVIKVYLSIPENRHKVQVA